jgi:MoxR-like ATPase
MAEREPLKFRPLFDLRGHDERAERPLRSVDHPDRRDGAMYRMPSSLHLAVEVALTAGRPLLLRGDPGTGKSSLAAYVARRLGWRYYEHVVTAQTTAAQLQWHFDAVGRLSDAQAHAARPEADYVEPGVLWWALNRSSAAKHGIEPFAEMNRERDVHRAVVLIDEIDKAHPDVPNGLLVALGSNLLQVPQLPDPISLDAQEVPSPKGFPKGVEVSRLLTVITSNEERELPSAFLRRCVVYDLEQPDAEELVAIARLHFDEAKRPFTKKDAKLATAIAERVVALRKSAEPGGHRPGTAELLDAFRAARGRFSPNRKDPRWQLIERIALAKPNPEEGT